MLQIYFILFFQHLNVSAVQSSDLLFVAVCQERLKPPVNVILTFGVGLSDVDAKLNQAVAVLLLGGHVRLQVARLFMREAVGHVEGPASCQGRDLLHVAGQGRGVNGSLVDSSVRQCGPKPICSLKHV